MAHYFHGERVSWPHKVILEAYERKHGYFTINDGKRTMAEQWEMLRRKGRYHPVTNPGGAAYPTPSAPHIKFGRVNHALDINDGLSDRVAAFYRSLGVPAVFNVPTEPWHIDFPDAKALKRAARKIMKRQRRIERARIRRIKRRLRKLGYKVKKGPKLGDQAKRQIKLFQRDHGLTPDGIAGPITMKAMKKAIRKQKDKKR